MKKADMKVLSTVSLLTCLASIAGIMYLMLGWMIHYSEKIDVTKISTETFYFFIAGVISAIIFVAIEKYLAPEKID